MSNNRYYFPFTAPNPGFTFFTFSDGVIVASHASKPAKDLLLGITR